MVCLTVFLIVFFPGKQAIYKYLYGSGLHFSSQFIFACALKCTQAIKCRAFTLNEDSLGRITCSEVYNTKDIVAQSLYIRVYATPTTAGNSPGAGSFYQLVFFF